MILGIDIGGTTTKLALVEGDRVAMRERMPTTGHADPLAFADAMADAAKTMARSVGAEFSSAGIGAPNANQLSGIIEQAPNLPWAQDVPLGELMHDRLGVPVTVGNDANAAAVGEWKYGAGRGMNDLLVVTLGTGLGSGYIVNGQLVLGHAGNAGELGHSILVPGGRPCTCGRSGCLEAYVSIRGMLATYLESLSHTPAAPMPADVRSIAQLAAAGQAAALACFERTAEWLAIGLANAVCATAPQRIVLFGGIAQSGDLLLAPLRKYFKQYLLNIYQDRVDLVTSALPEDDAALLGAAALGTLIPAMR